MRTGFLLLGLCFAVSVHGQSAPVIRAKLVPAKDALVGQPVRLEVEVLVPNFFTGAPVFPQFEMDGAIITLSDDRPEHLNEQIHGTTYAGIRRFYFIYPEQPSEFQIPSVEISVPYAAAPPAVTIAILHLPLLRFRAALPPEARGLNYFLPTSQLTIQQKWSGSLSHIRAGDAVGRTIVVTTEKMQAMLIPPLQLTAPDGVRIYPKGPSVEDQKSVNGAFTQGVRTERASYLFMKPGDYDLPGIEIMWWDLAIKKLRTSKLAATRVHVSESSAYVSELPPEKETPAAAQLPHNNGRQYLFIVKGGGIALVLAGIIVWLARRWGPRLATRYQAFVSRRQRSEAAHLRSFKHACNRNAPSRSYAFLLAWLRSSPGSLTLDEFQREAADPSLDEQISILASTLFQAETSASWEGRALYAAVARHRRVSVPNAAPLAHLPPLNPR
jgi:hypothetical protein